MVMKNGQQRLNDININIKLFIKGKPAENIITSIFNATLSNFVLITRIMRFKSIHGCKMRQNNVKSVKH